MNENIWNTTIIENYSLYELAKLVIPQNEFPVMNWNIPIKYILLDENIKNKVTPRFHCLTKQEENDILSGCWRADKDYEAENLPYGFYFVDCPLLLLEDAFKSWFNDPIIEKMILPFFQKKMEKSYMQRNYL